MTDLFLFKIDTKRLQIIRSDEYVSSFYVAIKTRNTRDALSYFKTQRCDGWFQDVLILDVVELGPISHIQDYNDS